MRFLVLGTGGREHAIAWRLLNDGSASEVYVLPGNGGIEDKYRVNINPSDHAAIAAFCAETGHTLAGWTERDGTFTITLRKSG